MDKINGTSSKDDFKMEYGRISSAFQKTGQTFVKNL